MNAAFVRYHTDQFGFRSAITVRGSKYFQAVIIDAPVRVMKKIPLEHEKQMKDLGDVRKAAKNMLTSSRHLGITKEAKKLLKRVLAEVAPNEN